MQLTEKQFIGEQIMEVAEQFATLRIEVFKEFPYLYEGNFEYELSYIKTYSSSPNAMLFALYNESEMIGATTCIPLEEETLEVKTPFIERNLDTDAFIYFGESLLLPSYRGLGFGKLFFKKREEHAKTIGKSMACFCSVNRVNEHPLRPLDYSDNAIFWQKQGYTEQTGMHCEMIWKDLDTADETVKTLTFWTKIL